MAKIEKERFGPDFVKGVIKECYGEAHVSSADLKQGLITVTWGSDGSFQTTSAWLNEVERLESGGALSAILLSLERVYGPTNYDDSGLSDVKDAKKREDADLAETFDKALDASGTDSKTKNKIMKNS